MKNKIIFFYVFISLISGGSIAQSSINLPMIVPASPEANALAKYINYPVNHSSGLVDINIPLYEIKVGDLTLPINLSYHASGIKVNENSGIVGLGWTLNAEPSVSRSIKGLEDEKGYWQSLNAYPMDYKQDQIYKMNVADGKFNIDEEPDEFYYKLLNKSGGFYISKKPRSTDLPKIVLHPYGPINITKVPNTPNASSVDAFDIVDDMGIKYNFSNIETTSTIGHAYIPTCWKASSITSASTSQVISFQYKPGSIERFDNFTDKVVVQDYISSGSPVTVSSSYIDELMGCPSNYHGAPLPRIWDTSNSNEMYYKYLINGQWTNDCLAPNDNNGVPEINPLRISQINFSGGKVVFEITINSGLGDRLSKIKVYSGTEIIKEFEFNYEGVNQGNRYTLKSIEVFDARGVGVEKYQFDYYVNDYQNHLSKSIDYWGYYNGAANNYFKSLVPLTTIRIDKDPWSSFEGDIQIGGANREPDFQSTLAQTLRKITYPTGGYTEFIYEPNKYKEGNQIKTAGGLRIHEILSPADRRTYTYGVQEDGVGLLRSPITDSFSYEQSDVGFNKYPPYKQSFSSRKRTYYSSALTDLFYSGGCPVFYDFVTEYLTYGNESLGKTEFQYRSEGTGGYGGSYRFPKTTLVVDLDWEWMYGQLVSKKNYKGSLATKSFTLVSSNDYTYNIINSLENSIYVGKAFRSKNLLGYFEQNSNYDSDAFVKQEGSVLYTSYSIPTGAIVLNSETSSIYTGESKLVTVTDYTYDNSVFPSPTAIKTTSSEGDLVTIRNKYPHDLVLTGSAEIARQKLISDFRVGTLLEQSKDKGSSISKTRTDYGIFNGKALPASVVTNTGVNFADESQIIYDSYDVNGNLLNVSKNNNDKVCYVWGYNKLYPVAKIENATYAQVEALAGFGTGFTLSAGLSPAQEASLRNNLPDAMVTTYKYSPMIGVTSITDPKGLITNYEYDSFNRLVLIKDQNRILKTFCYNYQGQLENCVKVIEYKSTVKTGNFKRNNCVDGFAGSTVVYTVAAGAYSSTVSQAAADDLAQADVSANGQFYANATGSCNALPVAPTGLTLNSATTSSITFSWNAVAGATSYNIWKNGSLMGTVTTTSFTLSGLSSSSTNSIDVSATNAFGNGPSCSPVQMTTLSAGPPAPTGLTFTSATATSINFSWTAVAGAISYKIYKNGTSVSTVSTASGSLSGLTESTAYSIQVSAVHASGDSALCPTVSMSTKPAAPTGLALNFAYPTTLTFSWNAVPGATSYNIWKSGSFMGSVTTTTGFLSGLSPANTYSIDVSATNASGNGPSCSPVLMKTLP